ncbi:hypothetical protein ACFOGI_07865 [Virgibacillus xinjiangensis]|uniref:Transmembrane protein n=1 Tax=Virgibacillus xinjiangensis TaxID=393090 RepID=A0ABV7CV12_9BACI
MQRNGMWLPLIASVGVGAATYYTMTRNDQNFGETMQKMIPLVTQMNEGPTGTHQSRS